MLAGAYSTRKADAPAYSPEAEKPWTTLMIRSRIGAQMPMLSYPGIRAMQNVAPDMIRMERESAVRRPTLSPIWPQTNPPSGRTRNEIANRAKVQQEPGLGIGFREEDRGDGDGQVAVNGVVEPFNEVADEAGRDDPAARFLADAVVSRRNSGRSTCCGRRGSLHARHPAPRWSVPQERGRKFRYSCIHQSVLGLHSVQRCCTRLGVTCDTVNAFLASHVVPRMAQVTCRSSSYGRCSVNQRRAEAERGLQSVDD